MHRIRITIAGSPSELSQTLLSASFASSMLSIVLYLLKLIDTQSPLNQSCQRCSTSHHIERQNRLDPLELLVQRANDRIIDDRIVHRNQQANKL